jgi:hypothetical protein
MKLVEATEKNSRRAATLAALEQKNMRAKQYLDEMIALRRRADELEAKASELRDETEEELNNLPEKIDLAPIQARLSSAQEVDKVRKLFAERRERQQRAENAQEESQRLTIAIAGIDKRAEEAIAASKLPAGLSLDAENKLVMLRGRPLAEAGTANKIIASVEVGMALNPDLRVMMIDEGSELDSEHMAMLEEIASARDYQVWVARVDEGEGGVGFRIEDGMVAGSIAASGKMQISDAAIETSKRRPR